MKHIGIIGTGAIGYPIAQHIIAGPTPVLFYARRESVIADLQSQGGTLCSIDELGAMCENVILFVNTFEQCIECIDQLFMTMHSGTICVGSTISPSQMCEIDSMCAKHGIQTLAMPVTGGVRGAVAGSLTIIVSGKRNLADEMMPIFALFGKDIIFAGENIHSAHTLKALIQLLVGINTAAMSEAFALGEKCGLPLDLIYKTICSSAGTTRIFENRGPTVMNADFHKRGTIISMSKDLNICSQLAAMNQVPLFLGDICAHLFSVGVRNLDCNEDFSAIIKLYSAANGVEKEAGSRRTSC